MRSITYVCIVPFMAISVIFSCIGNDDTTETFPENTLQNDTLSNVVDSDFIALKSYLIGEWLGEYSGFDARQDTMCRIKRKVDFLENNEYESIVQGCFGITEGGDEEYDLFEHEAGVYEYNEGTGVITYHVAYDSVINFVTQRLDSFPGKKIEGEGIFTEYQERIYFSANKDGLRRWIRKDDNLFVEQDSLIRLVYPMNKAN